MAYRAANKEKIAAQRASYRVRNKVGIAEYLAAYYAANKQRSASYCAENKEKIAARKSAYDAAHPEKRRVYKQNRRARKLKNGGRLTYGLAEKLLMLQRGRCACCGKMLKGEYHLDHIVPLSRGGANEDCNIQLLSPYCNMSKGAKDPLYFMQQKGFLI